MNILDRRSIIYKYIRNELGDDFIAVNRPDHPLLVDGPDLLVGNSKGLVSIFMIKSAEIRSSEIFKSRFILSRLAFPINTRFVFLVENKNDAIVDRFSRDFSEVINYKDKDSLIKLLQKPDKISLKEIPVEIYQGARRRFANTYAITRISLQDKYINPEINIRTTTHSLKSSIISESYDDPIQHFGGRFDDSDLRKLLRLGTQRLYKLDDGVPYSTHVASGIAILENMPSGRSDPNRLSRAAAFAGWAMLSGELSGSISRIRSILYQETGGIQ